MINKDYKLRFWCQKVLPLVYDDSLSYYELLNKVVVHLNTHTEEINALIDFYRTFADDVKNIIEQMIEDGEFSEIIAETIGSIIAEEYDPTETYILFDFAMYGDKLYRCTGETTGEWDESKWTELSVGDALEVLYSRVFGLNAGQVAYNNEAEYEDNTVGKELQDLSESISDLNTAVNTTELNIAPLYDTTATYNVGDYVTSASDGKVYRCIETTSGSWDDTKWTEVDVSNDLKGDIDTVKTNIAPLYNTTTSYTIGDYVTNDEDGKVYRCVANTSGSWDATKWTEVDVSNDLKNDIDTKQDIINSSTGGYTALSDFVTGTVASIKKFGKVVSFFMYTSTNILTVDSARVFNFLAINEGYRPSEIVPPIFSWESNGVTHLKSGGILPDGTVQIYFNPATDGASIDYLSCDIVYIID